MILIESCVFIAYANTKDHHHERAVEIVKNIAKGECGPTNLGALERNPFNACQNPHIMHELSMATSVLDIILEKAKEENATKIFEITIEIGELLFLNPEQFQFCMELVTENTLAEGATLTITVKPSKLRCKVCGNEFDWRTSPDDYIVFPVLQCECGSKDLEIMEGRELNIVSIRIEKPD